MKRNNNKNGTEFITKHKRLMFQRLVTGCVELDIKPVRNYIIIILLSEYSSGNQL